MHVKNLLAGMVLGIAGLLGQAQAIEPQSAPSPLIDLQLQSTRDNHALGEIVELELVLRDVGKTATPVQPPNPYFGNLQLFISSDGVHYREYTGPRWGSVHARQQARKLAPGEELRVAVPVLYNHRMPVDDLCGELVELDSLWGGAAGDLRDELLESPAVESRFRCLERWLLRRAMRPLSLDPLVEVAMRKFANGTAAPAIARVAEEAGVSHKQFIKRFGAAVGLSPKRLCRIRRFNRAVADLRARREVDWADVAATGGYYDQAHLIHDFRAFSGMTPGRYLGQPGADERFVPVSD